MWWEHRFLPLSALSTSECLAMALPINLLPAAGVSDNCLKDDVPPFLVYQA